MTKYEFWSLGVQIVGIVVAIGVIIIAVLGEKIRQWLSRAKLAISLREPNLSITTDQKKGWYYLLKVENSRRSCPAEDVRVWITKIYKKGPDGSWLEKTFSGPVQVTWQWPNSMPQFLTIGPEINATFAAALQNTESIQLCIYWCPNNLDPFIRPNEPTRLCCKAVSNSEESNEITIEISWDGTWVEGKTEMAQHLMIKQCSQ